jgi:hypothetical protein
MAFGGLWLFGRNYIDAHTSSGGWFTFPGLTLVVYVFAAFLVIAGTAIVYFLMRSDED